MQPLLELVESGHIGRAQTDLERTVSIVNPLKLEIALTGHDRCNAMHQVEQPGRLAKTQAGQLPLGLLAWPHHSPDAGKDRRKRCSIR